MTNRPTSAQAARLRRLQRIEKDKRDAKADAQYRDRLRRRREQLMLQEEIAAAQRRGEPMSKHTIERAYGSIQRRRKKPAKVGT